jgi:hypothetical protein
MRILGLALACTISLLGAASGANAEACPTRADVDGNGVRLTRSSPYMTLLITNRGDTQIAERRTKRNGKTQRVRTTYLHPLAVAQRQDNRSVLTMKYSRNTKSLHKLDRNKVWRSGVEVLNGRETFSTGKVTMRLRGKGTHKIGNCSYPVWSVVESYEMSGKPLSMREKIYAPTLGLVLASYKLRRDGKKRASSHEPNHISAE